MEKKRVFSHPFEINFIDKTHCPQLGEARIGMSMCPGRVWLDWCRSLDDDIRVIVLNRVDVVCSIITNTELREMNHPDLMTKFRSYGLDSLQYSIHDKWLPNSIENFLSIVEMIVYHIQSEKSILVHCNGGKGRTGLIVVACLIVLGIEVDKSISIIRSVRSGMLRNPAQEVFLHALSSRLRGEDTEKQQQPSPKLTSTSQPRSTVLSSPQKPTVPPAHTHLSDYSESVDDSDSLGNDVDQANSSTEHSQ